MTLDMAQEVLHDLLRANERQVTIDEIQKQGGRALQHPDVRHAPRRGGLAPWRGRARSRCISPSS